MFKKQSNIPHTKTFPLEIDNRLDKLIGNNQVIQVTFIFEDKSRITQDLNEQFLKNSSGNRKLKENIMKDLQSIKDDLGAKEFYI